MTTTTTRTRKPRSRVRSEERATYDSATPNGDDAIIAAALAILDARARDAETMTDPRAAGAYMRAKLAGLEREHFIVAFLDTRHRLIACDTLFTGTIDGCEVHPREVARAALMHNAAAVILAHNHPSGNPEPSAADRAVTARLKQALALIDVRLLDHFVVGDGPAVSMAARGWV